MSHAAYDIFSEVNDNPAEAALLARIQRYFRQAIHSLPKKDQARALAAPDDFWTLMETLALAPVQESPELRVRLLLQCSDFFSRISHRLISAQAAV